MENVYVNTTDVVEKGANSLINSNVFLLFMYLSVLFCNVNNNVRCSMVR